MAWVSTALPYITAGVSILGTVQQSRAQKEAGKVSQQQSEQSARNETAAAEFEARQAEYLASQAIAVSHREAYEQRKASALLASKALAIAAGSGASASDQSVVNMITEIYAEGAYRSALAMYEGKEAERSYNVQAQARRLSGKSYADARIQEGRSTKEASKISSFSTLLSGASSLLDLAGTWK